jgi:Fe-S-cluster-containing hydrogenase component 2/flavodoxin
MDTTLYYFSGTGNSLYIARELSKKIKGCEIKPMAKYINNQNITADSAKIGFIFPLYYYGLPLIVDDFIKKINMDKSEYIFYVMTSGGGSSPDFATSKIKKNLARKRKKLNAGFRIMMPGNYIKLYNPDSDELVRMKNIRSISQMNNIAKIVNNNQIDIKRNVHGFIARTINAWWKSRVLKGDSDFKVTPACNSCAICEKVCPVNNIKIENGRPVWLHNCQECLSCLHFCPQVAIESKKSASKSRYHHAQVTVKDIIEQKL